MGCAALYPEECGRALLYVFVQTPSALVKFSTDVLHYISYLSPLCAVFHIIDSNHLIDCPAVFFLIAGISAADADVL
jgi:hypothetical protein